MPSAFITGITGQDGSYLAELLLAKGYQVHGLVRPSCQLDSSGLQHLCQDPTILHRRLVLHRAALEDVVRVRQALRTALPAEIYHLAGQSHVGLSFDIPEQTCEVIALGTLRLLEMARAMQPAPKFFHASSSEIFGMPASVPQTEETPVAPVNPYGCAKAFATQMVAVYRQTHRLFACNGILYNHESPRRGEGFVTRKICRAAAAIKLGLQQELVLGDTGAHRDWGHARDFVQGMWLAMQHPEPTDFIFATGQLHSVQDAVREAFAAVQLDWRQYVRSDPSLSRPAETRVLVGDATKAKRLLGWSPQTHFEELIRDMTAAELGELRKNADKSHDTPVPGFLAG